MTSGRAPVVAIVIGCEPAHRFSVHRGYIDALVAVGAVPLVLPATAAGHERMLDSVAHADALLLTGGGDIDPSLYAPTISAAVEALDPARDSLEVWSYIAMRQRGRRVLGVCRGAQVMAVAAGGTLYQDLEGAGYEGHCIRERENEVVHAVTADAGTAAGAALAGATKVNSIHHQAVLDPGDLRATAWSDDGVIEAVEADGALGVQWHPERLFDADARHLAPFQWLVAPT